MRDALGGTVNLVIIVMFIVIALSYMAFNVNYMKAYRMKNKIVDSYNDFDGQCDSNCIAEIQEYASEIGYHPQQVACPEGYNPNNVFTYCTQEVNRSIDGVEPVEMRYYRIATKIDFDFPIIRNILGNLNYFWIKGDTKVYKIENNIEE